MSHFRVPTALLFFATAAALNAVNAVDVERTRQAYAANNANDDAPLVSWLDWGMPQFLLYKDGVVIVADARFKSRLGTARLSKTELAAALETLSRPQGFAELAPEYALTQANDQPMHIVALRLPGRRSTRVSVYGNLTWSGNDRPPPPAFVHFLDLLDQLKPADVHAWDPGYVDILWVDYHHAPEQSLPWPEEWPNWQSPLTRAMTNKQMLIEYITSFPTAQLAELDAVLARRPERGALLIDGRKMSAHYRWPVRGEKEFTSWIE